LLLQRAVTEVEVDASGRLRPRAGAAWRPEPARGEASLHRRLAKLTEATGAQLAAFASTYGFLRVHGSAIFGMPGPESVASTVAIGQEALDAGTRVEEWFNAGAIGDPPPATEDTLLAIELFAALPDWIFATFEATNGREDPDVKTDPGQFFRVGLPVAVAASRAIQQHGFNLARFRQLDPVRVRRALRLNEWFNRVIGGLEETPASLAAVGGADGLIRQLTSTAPELFAIPNLFGAQDADVVAFLDALATETVDDWRTAAAEHRDLVRSIDLIRSAIGPDGIVAADKQDLADLHADLAGYRSSMDLAAAEIAERTRPLLAARLEGRLTALGAWPLRRGALAGVLVRSFVAAWVELTDAAPATACATLGCPGTFAPRRNRLYCDSCQTARSRDAVRRTRAAASSQGPSGPGRVQP
jgi:hypothetical protein